MELENGEKIIKILRRHIVVLLPMILILILLAMAPIVLYFLITSDFFVLNSFYINLLNQFLDNWGIFIYSVFLIFIWIAFFIEWTDYYLDLWIVTNKRIIDVEQKGFFHREVTSFKFEQIQDITTETRGVLETFLKYGTLHIQTAGHDRQIVIKDAQDPEEAKRLILGLQNEKTHPLIF